MDKFGHLVQYLTIYPKLTPTIYQNKYGKYLFTFQYNRNKVHLKILINCGLQTIPCYSMDNKQHFFL